jgi:sarcosine oxidase subunit alpha
MTAAGAANGELGLADALAAGAKAGLQAAADCGLNGQPVDLPDVDPESAALAPLWRVRGTRGKAFVDLQNDVTDADVTLAGQEGFRSVEHLKRYTTLGMATDQGKTSNLNGLALMAELSTRTIPQTGTTTFRPPFAPVAIGALAGHHRGKDFKPARLPPSHRWAQEQGAVFVETGLWLRAQWYPRPGEADWLESVSREVRTVRASVGVCDVSTLGKIDLQGGDAAAFLDRLYTNSWKPWRRQGALRSHAARGRIGAGRWHHLASCSGAVHHHDHHRQRRQGPSAHGVLPPAAVAGARRAILLGERAVGAVLLGRPAIARCLAQDRRPSARNCQCGLSYMAAAELTVMGGCRRDYFRISFSGELAYEIAVPAGYGDDLMRRIMEAGREFGIAPYGTEALGVMRLEKGHVAGNEINGQTTARDLGLDKMLSTRKEYIGRVMAQRPGLLAPDRPTLTGFKPVNRSDRLRAGAHFIREGAEATARNDEGYMTSVAFSPTLGHWIGLGLLAHGPTRHGEKVRAWDPVRGGDVLVEACNPVFYDPAGERLRG